MPAQLNKGTPPPLCTCLAHRVTPFVGTSVVFPCPPSYYLSRHRLSQIQKRLSWRPAVKTPRMSLYNQRPIEAARVEDGP